MTAARIAFALVCVTTFSVSSHGGEPRVAIQVREGGHVIQCRVQRRSDHRWLAMGIVDRTESQRGLNGDAAPITHTIRYRQLEVCGDDGEWLRAYCAVGAWKDTFAVVYANMPCQR